MYSLNTTIHPSVPPRELSRIPSTVTAKGDSAASNHFMTEKDEHILKDVQPISPLSITLPDSCNIDGTRKGNLPIPHLSKFGIGCYSSSSPYKFIINITRTVM